MSVATEPLVIRTEPGISTYSRIRPPNLVNGAQMYVLHGPVLASSHEWYEVAPLAARYASSGWIASASESGEPWIVPGKATCPKAPTTVAGLASLTDGLRLACFSRVQIKLSALLVKFIGSVDPGYLWDPAWFGQQSVELVDPTNARSTRRQGGPFFLILDPAADAPEPLPVSEVQWGDWNGLEAVQVTGMFDHPAARACTATLWSPREVFRDWCRSMFVVTEIR